MPTRTARKINFGFGLALLPLLIVAWFAYQTPAQLIENMRERKQCFEILIILDRTRSDLQGADAEHRGFLLTGDARYRARYRNASDAIERDLTELRQLLRERPDQQRRLSRLEPSVRRRLAELAGTIEIGNEPQRGFERAREVIGAEPGLQLTEDIEKRLGELQQAEYAVLERFSQATASTARQTLWVVSLIGPLAMIAVSLAGLAIHRDLAGRARAEAEVNRQRNILRSVLDSLGDGVMMVNEKGELQVFNPAAERLLGVRLAEMLPLRHSSRKMLFLPDGVTPFPPSELPLVQTLRGATVEDVEVAVRPNSDAPGIFVSVSGRPIKDEQGAVCGGVIVFRDITERKLAFQRAQLLNDELDRRVALRTAELAAANRELTQRTQESELFIYSVSHDLRSPLVNLQGFSQEIEYVCRDLRTLLTDPAIPPPVSTRGVALIDQDLSEAAHYIRTAVMRLSGIIDALLRLSRAGRVVYQLQSVDLTEAVRRILTAQSITIAEKGAHVELKALPPACGDPVALEQVFANLIDNALKYLDPQRPGRIEIGCLDGARPDAPPGDQGFQTYYVRDNGQGIPEDLRDKVFQAFERLHPQAAPGEGIGLSLVRRIVERHEGRIWFESTPGQGTTFFVALASDCPPNAPGSPNGRTGPT